MLARLHGLNGHLRLPTSRLYARAFTQAPPTRHYTVGRLLLVGVAAGTVGGGVILGAGYAWYRYSGVHGVVERFWPAVKSITTTKEEIGTKPPSHVLRHFRTACKAYVSHLPGAGFIVDRAFDKLDDTVDAHAEEANALIRDASTQALLIFARNRNAPTAHSAIEILSIARQLGKDLGTLGIKAAHPMMQNLDLENKAAQLSGTTAAVYDVAKTKGTELSSKLAGAAEQVKTTAQNFNAPARAVEKLKSFIFRNSEK